MWWVVRSRNNHVDPALPLIIIIGQQCAFPSGIGPRKTGKPCLPSIVLSMDDDGRATLSCSRTSLLLLPFPQHPRSKTAPALTHVGDGRVTGDGACVPRHVVFQVILACGIFRKCRSGECDFRLPTMLPSIDIQMFRMHARSVVSRRNTEFGKIVQARHPKGK